MVACAVCAVVLNVKKVMYQSTNFIYLLTYDFQLFSVLARE